MLSDPIADFLTRLRNGLLAKRTYVRTNSSNMSNRLAEILLSNGYLDAVEQESEGPRQYLKVKLRYDDHGEPMARGFKRISRPGLRAYSSAKDIPSVQNGMGLAIVSTSKGVITGKEALKQNVGGEVLCFVW